MFVTSSNFSLLPYILPNIEQNTGFADYVDREEKDRLLKLLGVAFYDEFVAAFEALPDDWSAATTYVLNDLVVSGNDIYKSLQVNNTNHPLSDGAWWVLEEEDNKWLLLINGENYQHNNIDYKWEGMVKLFTPYIYSRYVEDNRESLTGTGVVDSKNENSEIANPINQICRSWNDFAKRAGDKCNVANSLYGYLFEKEDNFDSEIVWENPGTKNFLGI